MHGWKRWALIGGIVAGRRGRRRPVRLHPPHPGRRESSAHDRRRRRRPSPTTTHDHRTSASLDGTWKVASGSTAGYRVKETLFGQSATAVGRTTAVTGEFTLAGTTVPTASFSVDLTQVSSDRSQRDGQFQGRIMDTAQFPTATFELTNPIDLGSVPANGVEITPKATGKLTLHGTTKTVTVDLTAKRTGNNIQVLGSIPITFADYGIDNPSGGPASVGDNGTLEFLLVLAKAVDRHGERRFTPVSTGMSGLVDDRRQGPQRARRYRIWTGASLDRICICELSFRRVQRAS